MSEQRSLIVGFDLCNDFSQISCYSHKTFEPESICMTSDQTKYLIPTILGVRNDTKDWVFGEEAISYNQAGSAVLIDGLLKRVEKSQETELFGVKFQPITLLEKYFRKCLLLLKTYYPSNSIQQLVVTVKDKVEIKALSTVASTVESTLEVTSESKSQTGGLKNEILVETVYKALENLGIDRDRALVQSHSQSYQYYALSQSKELWMNDIGLFEFDENGLTYHQITINRKVHPFIVGMVQKDFTETLSYSMLEELGDSENLEYVFDNIAKSVLYKQIISTIYITGKGFEGTWADKVIKELCIGRRVFKGQNLYTKGACYAAKEMAGEDKFNDFIFLSNEMIMSTILIPGYYDAKTVEAVIVKAATPWYEINEKLDIILDDEQEITLLIKDLIKRETVPYSIALDGLPNRPNKTTRVEVRLKFLSRTTAVITIKDKGFGDFYPSTNRIWEKEISIQ